MTKSAIQVPKKRSSLKREVIASEYQECLAYYQWTQLHPKLKGLVIHIPNEGLRSWRMGKKLKAIGLCKGVPDYFIPIANRKFHGLFIEMKKRYEGKVTESQEEWASKLKVVEYFIGLAYGATEAIMMTQYYLNDMI